MQRRNFLQALLTSVFAFFLPSKSVETKQVPDAVFEPLCDKPFDPSDPIYCTNDYREINIRLLKTLYPVPPPYDFGSNMYGDLLYEMNRKTLIELTKQEDAKILEFFNRACFGASMPFATQI